jgi:hypothetical protein
MPTSSVVRYTIRLIRRGHLAAPSDRVFFRTSTLALADRELQCYALDLISLNLSG